MLRPTALRATLCATLLLIIFQSLAMRAHAQQEPQFSQYVFSGIVLNPAYAGYNKQTSFNLSYRSQWNGLAGSPATFAFSAESTTGGGKNGIGIVLLNDQIGPLKSTNAELIYSRKLFFDSEQVSGLSFGLSAGLNHLLLDPNQITGLEPVDPILNELSTSANRPLLSAGTMYSNAHYFVGLKASNLLSSVRFPASRIYSLQTYPHYYLNMGAIFDLNTLIKFKPTLLIKEDFKAPTNFDLNTFFLFDESIWLGLSYQGTTGGKAGSMSFLLEYYPVPNLRIGYAYDNSLNKLRKANNGSHEFSIGVFLPSSKKGHLRCYF